MYTLYLVVGFIIDCISYQLTVLCFHPRVLAEFVLVDDFWLLLDVYRGTVGT